MGRRHHRRPVQRRFHPYLLVSQHEVKQDAAFGGWLMPVVPPMVSAATGALLVPHVAAGSGRATLLYSCYAMFGLSLIASLIIITMIWSRLAHFGSSGTSRVPTLWIVLGPFGQSITAAGLLGANASLAVDPQLASGVNVFRCSLRRPHLGLRPALGRPGRIVDRSHHQNAPSRRAHLVELHLPLSAPS